MVLQVTPADLAIASAELANVHTSLSAVLATASEALTVALDLGKGSLDDPSREFFDLKAPYQETFRTHTDQGVTNLLDGQRVLVPTGKAYEETDKYGEAAVKGAAPEYVSI